MLIEELFSKGGASKADPERQVGVFRTEAASQLATMREAELEKFRWVVGEWDYENWVPATRWNPAYVDIGSSRFSLCEKGAWI
jgi:hypothetical protein